MIKLAAAMVKRDELEYIALEHHINHNAYLPSGVLELNWDGILIDQLFAPGSMFLNTLILVSPNKTRITYMYAYGEDLTRGTMAAFTSANTPYMQECRLVRVI